MRVCRLVPTATHPFQRKKKNSLFVCASVVARTNTKPHIRVEHFSLLQLSSLRKKKRNDRHALFFVLFFFALLYMVPQPPFPCSTPSTCVFLRCNTVFLLFICFLIRTVLWQVFLFCVYYSCCSALCTDARAWLCMNTTETRACDGGRAEHPFPRVALRLTAASPGADCLCDVMRGCLGDRGEREREIESHEHLFDGSERGGG